MIKQYFQILVCRIVDFTSTVQKGKIGSATVKCRQPLRIPNIMVAIGIGRDKNIRQQLLRRPLRLFACIHSLDIPRQTRHSYNVTVSR